MDRKDYKIEILQRENPEDLKVGLGDLYDNFS